MLAATAAVPLGLIFMIQGSAASGLAAASDGTPPSVLPTMVTTPTSLPEVTTTSSTARAAVVAISSGAGVGSVSAGGNSSSRRGGLPVTGSDIAALGLVGTGLVGSGATLYGVGRRRRAGPYR